MEDEVHKWPGLLFDLILKVTEVKLGDQGQKWPGQHKVLGPFI